MKNRDIDYGITIIPEIRERYLSTVGWCSRAVDSIVDRLVFRDFENDRFNISDIFKMNGSDILFYEQFFHQS